MGRRTIDYHTSKSHKILHVYVHNRNKIDQCTWVTCVLIHKDGLGARLYSKQSRYITDMLGYTYQVIY